MTTHMLANRTMARQGDVLLKPIDRVPEDQLGPVVTEGEGARIVLAHGEATGHAHALYPDRDVADGVAKQTGAPPRLHELHHPERYNSLPCRLLRLETRALLRHEEHDPVSLPAGDWLVIQQHEGDELEGLRRVAD